MSMNYVFGFFLFLLLLIALNIYFFYTLMPISKKPINFNVPSIKLDLSPSVFKDIYDYLNYLPSQYKSRNQKFQAVQKTLISSFSPAIVQLPDVWPDQSLVASGSSLYPHKNEVAGQILHAMKTSPIALVDNAAKGTQLKLLLLLEGKQKLYFKPKRYELDHVIRGSIVAGFDRHNAEVFAYYLAMTMNLTWIPPSVIRKVNVDKEIVPVATLGLKKTMIRNANAKHCIYGKCFYCKINETVCPDHKGEIEGAAILYLDKPFQFNVYKSPWQRNYHSTKLMEWQKNSDFCKLKLSTWRHLELLSGGSLTETIKLLSAFQGVKLATEEHFRAVERRLLKLYATVQYCIGKHGSAKVFKTQW
ncbi:hypothetical protein MSG28_011131 [Choristoneura fumiferana]|uniref:Uncharacterized protein n=1 Tax=Choristoneura fumiferana TaxID=7141 RepID=A0ACC0KQH4_CHOFU|nr:hypothetical protein MSG28_011131 [Choristoneura fumiferana]